jgi:hypothetical protein
VFDGHSAEVEEYYEPIFESESSCPQIKKIAITTDHSERREKELLGTISPIKISIVTAWTGIKARIIESMLHNLSHKAIK